MGLYMDCASAHKPIPEDACQCHDVKSKPQRRTDNEHAVVLISYR